MTDFHSPAAVTSTDVDLTVPVAPTISNRLRISDDELAWGTSCVLLDEVVAVRYAIRNESTALWTQRRVSRVMAHTVSETLEMVLGTSELGAEAAEMQSAAYYATIECLHRVVEPRLRLMLFDRIDRGARVDMGPLSLTTEGILVETAADARQLVAWHRLPSAQFDDARVTISADGPSGTVIVGDVSMLAPNAVLLPELCIDAIARYG